MLDQDECQRAWQYGGRQLYELVQKQIPFEYFLRCMHYLKLTPYDLFIFKTWLDCEGSIEQTIALLKKRDDVETSVSWLHELFGKMLVKIFFRINMTPQLDKHGEVIQPLSFVQYDIFDIEETEFKVVATRVNPENYWHPTVYQREQAKFENLHVFARNKNGEWRITNKKYAREYKESYKKMTEMLNGGY